jgi:hypothetical protein
LINVGAIAITAKAVVDARPVRYHLSELEDYIRGRLMGIRRPVIARVRLRKWAKAFVDSKIEANDHDGDMHPETYRVDRRHRRKDY